MPVEYWCLLYQARSYAMTHETDERRRMAFRKVVEGKPPHAQLMV